MRIQALLFALFTTAFASSCSSEQESASFVAPPNPAELRIMPLGDSITAAENSPGGYRAQLQEILRAGNYPFVFVGSQSNGPVTMQKRHEGHPGFWTENLSADIERWVNEAQPDVVLLMIGTNDILNNAGEAAPERLRTLVDQIQTTKPDTWVVLSSIIPIRDHEQARDAYNQEVRALAQELKAAGKKVEYADVGSTVTVEDTYDGIHPETPGYDKMASAWLPALDAIYEAESGAARG